MATVAADLSGGQIAMVGQARYTMEHRNLTTNLFSKYVLAQGEKSYFVPKFGSATAVGLTDGVDMTQENALTMGGSTMTTNEAGCKVIVTRKLREQLKEDAFKAAGNVVGSAIARYIDVAGCTLFSGLDTVVGAASSTFASSRLGAAITQMYGQAEPVPEPFYCVLHPYTFYDIVGELAIPATNNIPPGIQEDVLRTYFRGSDKLFNCPIFTTGNVPLNASGANDAYGAVFSRLAMLYLVGWEPFNWNEPDNSARSWEIGVVADFNMVEVDGTYGRALLYDATAPTS